MTTWPYTGTYKCWGCGQYVPVGSTHSCPGYQPATGGNSIKWVRMTDVRIADALERIAAALEAQNQDRDPASRPS